jgi:hypothetical protein
MTKIMTESQVRINIYNVIDEIALTQEPNRLVMKYEKKIRL